MWFLLEESVEIFELKDGIGLVVEDVGIGDKSGEQEEHCEEVSGEKLEGWCGQDSKHIQYHGHCGMEVERFWS